MTKKTTLKEIGEMLAHVVEHMLTKEDGEKFATKDQIVALHTQVNAIETQLRDMKHTKLQSRVADLEERVFGPARTNHIYRIVSAGNTWSRVVSHRL